MSIPMKLEKAKIVKVPAAGGGGFGAAAAAAAGGAVAGAVGVDGMIPVVWTASEMNFRFNPTQLSVNKSATYGGTNNRESDEGGQEQFASTGTRALSFSALLDEWEAPAGSDVGDMVKTLQNCCNIDRDGPEPYRPPTMMFVWGKFSFTGVIDSVNATFELFRKDGTPARAELQVSMKERPDEATGTNPTSGGPPGRRSRTLVEGDTIAGLAFRELGDSKFWRVIAEMNGIDDPATVRPGTAVLLPSSDDAALELRRMRATA